MSEDLSKKEQKILDKYEKKRNSYPSNQIKSISDPFLFGGISGIGLRLVLSRVVYEPPSASI